MLMEQSDTKQEDAVEYPWLGLSLSRKWQYWIWGPVLVLAIGVPGLTYHNLTSVEAVAWYKYLNTTLIVAALAGALFTLLFFVTKRDVPRAIAMTSVITLVLFLWPGFSRLEALPSVLGPLAVVLAPAGIIWIVAKHGVRSRVAAFTLLFASTLMLTNAAKVAQLLVLDPTIEEFVASETLEDSERPDVLFILLDAYGRDDILSELYGFDNSPFLGDMRRLGFSVDHSASANYNRTYATVSSIMDLGYPIDVGLASDEQNGVVRGLLGQNGTLVSAFHQSGYEVTYSENGWGGSRCGDDTDNCWREGTTANSAYNLARLTPFAPLSRIWFTHPLATKSFTQFQDLSAVFDDLTASDKPQLVWSHFMLPHPPLRLDRSCVAHREPWRNSQTMTMGDSADALRREAYIDQMVCVNSVLLEQLEDVLRQNPTTAVYVFGDHGPDGAGQLSTAPSDMTAEQIHERLGVLLAVREPSGCYDERSSNTLVTAAREFVSCVLDIDMQPIEERSILVPFRARPSPAIEASPPSR